MTAAAKKEDQPEIRKEGSPPGPAQWCANCIHFRPGPIVVQGNTLGGCHAGEQRPVLVAGKLSAADIAALTKPGGHFIEYTPAQTPTLHRIPREVLANDWCQQHRPRLTVEGS